MSTTLSNIVISSTFSAQVASGQLAGTVTHNPASKRPAVGTSSGNADLLYSAVVSVTAGSPLDIDLTSLVDPAGNSISIAHLLYYVVENTATVNDLAIGGGSNPIWASADPKPITPGNFAEYQNFPTGTVIDGTHKIFRLTASLLTVTGKVTFLGRST